MLQVYSNNVSASANAIFPLNNVTLQKGCSEKLSGVGIIELNKCGVYMVAVDGTAATASTIQLQKNGILQPQAISTGESLSFTTLVQVQSNNTNCCCSSPTFISIMNPSTATQTLTNLHVAITKVC